MENPDGLETEEDEISRPGLKVAPGETILIKPEQLLSGKELVLFAEDGHMLASVRRNPNSNGKGIIPIKSCTLITSAGHELLFPVPAPFSSAKAMQIYADEESWFNPNLKAEISRLFGQDFEIEATKSGMLVVSNVSKADEYYLLDDGSKGRQAEMRSGVNSRIGQIEAGNDGVINGVINGGRKFCAATYRELGTGRYQDRNEDNVGVDYDNGIIVLADGMGGNGYGDLASHLAVESVIRDGSADLRGKLNNARDRLLLFNRMMDLAYAPDATFEAVQLSGDKYRMIFKGDSRFLHIRKGKCIYSNIPGNVAWQMYMIGQISYAATFNDEGRSILTNTLLRGAGTDYVEKDMLPGDILVMYTDGLAYSEAEIAEIVSGNDAEDAVKILTEGTADRNMDGTFPIKILPGMPEPVIKPGEKLTGESPRDNASVVVYPHI